jgi:hypothetical protein
VALAKNILTWAEGYGGSEAKATRRRTDRPPASVRIGGMRRCAGAIHVRCCVEVVVAPGVVVARRAGRFLAPLTVEFGELPACWWTT